MSILICRIVGIAEPPLRLVLSLLSSYLLGFAYRLLFLRPLSKPLTTLKETVWRHLFSIGTGTALAFFNYGQDTLHFYVAIIGSWLLLWLLGPNKKGVTAVFVFAFGYLLVGYSLYASDDYDLNWTTSYCVTTLRLIGLAMDYADGAELAAKKKKDVAGGSSAAKADTKSASALQISWDQVELNALPSLIETLSYNLFYGGFLVGPQFPFVIYKRFITLQIFQKSAGQTKMVIPGCWLYALRCFLLGVLYMVLTQLGQMYFPPAFVLSKAFTVDYPLWKRLLYMTAAGRVVFYKYLGVWLLNEGGCVLSGISFNGYDPVTKKAKWDGLTNIFPLMFELPTSYLHVIGSFNVNTNLWVKNYVFKRLRFLGNKTLSGLGALLFLAIWHGFAFSYFGSFTAEFMDVEAERMVQKWMYPLIGWMYEKSHPRYRSPLATLGRAVNNLISFCLVLCFVSFGTVTFDLLSYERVTTFWKSVYFFSHLSVLSVFLINFVIAGLCKRKSRQEKGKQKSQ